MASVIYHPLSVLGRIIKYKIANYAPPTSGTSYAKKNPAHLLNKKGYWDLRSTEEDFWPKNANCRLENIAKEQTLSLPYE